MATLYKKPKKDRLKAAFIEAAQIMRNILVFEPANKHRIKQEIYQEKAAGKDIDIDGYENRIGWGIATTVSAYSLAAMGFTIGATVSGGALLPVIGVLACLSGTFFSGPVKAVLLIDGGYERIVKRFERQADKKVKRLTDKQNKRARQLLLNGDI